MVLFSGLAAASVLLVALGARAGHRLGATSARAICVSFFSRGVGAALSGARASYLSSRGGRWGAPPRRPGWSSARRVKLVEYGEDAGAHDRRALEGGGGAKHEGDKDTLHIYMCWGAEEPESNVLRLSRQTRSRPSFFGSVC